MNLENQLKILQNRRDDVMYNLEYCAKDYRTDIDVTRELALLHGQFSFDVYDFKDKHKLFNFQKTDI